MAEKYRVLTSSEFFDKYKDKLSLTPGKFKFTTQAYSQADTTIGLYEEELALEIYLQCPNYKTVNVPKKRRFIYKVPKDLDLDRYESFKDTHGTRYKILFADLTMISDPYEGVYQDPDLFSPSPELPVDPPKMEEAIVAELKEEAKKPTAGKVIVPNLETAKQVHPLSADTERGMLRLFGKEKLKVFLEMSAWSAEQELISCTQQEVSGVKKKLEFYLELVKIHTE